MEARKQARLKMYHSVMALCEDNVAIVSLLAGFESAYQLFKAKVVSIDAKATHFKKQTGGLKISKRSGKKKLAQKGSEIAGLVFAYGSSIGDEVMMEAMRITDSDIIRAMDEEVVAICNNIYKTALTNVAALGGYGITPLELSVFEESITAYVNISPKPRGSRSQRKALRQLMYTEFEEADAVLHNRMDKVAVSLKHNGNVSFYLHYRESRVIVDPGSFKTVLKLLVLNSVSNAPIKNVKCYRDDSEVRKLSSSKGLLTYKDAEQGYHRFTLKRKLFKDVEVTVMVGYGEKKVVAVMMEAEHS